MRSANDVIVLFNRFIGGFVEAIVAFAWRVGEELPRLESPSTVLGTLKDKHAGSGRIRHFDEHVGNMVFL